MEGVAFVAPDRGGEGKEWVRGGRGTGRGLSEGERRGEEGRGGWGGMGRERDGKGEGVRGGDE